MTLVERFLKYVSFDTQSSEETGLTPSTPGQMVFAEYLKSELESLGLEDISLDEHGYLFATLPANTEKEVPTIGFIAHMDTSPDMSGKDVKPRIIENYGGGDIIYPILPTNCMIGIIMPEKNCDFQPDSYNFLFVSSKVAITASSLLNAFTIFCPA